MNFSFIPVRKHLGYWGKQAVLCVISFCLLGKQILVLFVSLLGKKQEKKSIVYSTDGKLDN